MRGLVPMALSILLASACSGGGENGACDDEDGCPAGDAGGGDDARADASAAGAPCGTTDLLVEDFETSDPDRRRWIPFNFGPGLPPAIENGRAVLSFDAAGEGGAPGFFTARDYRFDESQVSIDAAGVVDLGEVQTRVYLRYPMEGNLGFRVSAGQLEAVARDPGAAGEEILQSVSFDPANHRHWRLRESGDQAYLETSPDGATWSQLAATSSRRFARPAPLFFVVVEAATEAGEISIEGVNLAGELAATGWCPIDLLIDDFDDPAVADVWKVAVSGGCSATEADGVLEMVNPVVDGSCSYASALGQILRDRAVSVEAVAPGDGAPDLAFVVQLGVGGQSLAFQHLDAGGDGSRLQVQRLDPGELPGDADAEILADEAFDPELHRFWRFRHQDGALHAETAPDGAAWSSLLALGDLAVDDVFVRLETTRAGAGAVAFDDLNQIP